MGLHTTHPPTTLKTKIPTQEASGHPLMLPKQQKQHQGQQQKQPQNYWAVTSS